ncbi:hypothetical protein H5410_017867 [Solanum commersonii]|uniref:Uncharacterized protein n=1 Tax=Solanum commersonii TaxID=4109 RepID=A0A9J6A187_SOLCO|nr:hypothetical protein H5410_017867 [Solanum commersonii]
MLQAKDLIEHQILWHTNKGSTSVWHDNWIGRGDLYTITGEDFAWDDTYKEIVELTQEGKWNEDMLKEILPQVLVHHILQNIQTPRSEARTDVPCWMLEQRGISQINHRGNISSTRKRKIKFIMDDRVRRWGLEEPSICWCCERPQQEILTHVFLKSKNGGTPIDRSDNVVVED